MLPDQGKRRPTGVTGAIRRFCRWALVAGLVTLPVGQPALATAPPTPPTAVGGGKVPLPHLRPKMLTRTTPALRPSAGPGTPVALPSVPVTPGFAVNPNSRF